MQGRFWRGCRRPPFLLQHEKQVVQTSLTHGYWNYLVPCSRSPPHLVAFTFICNIYLFVCLSLVVGLAVGSDLNWSSWLERLLVTSLCSWNLPHSTVAGFRRELFQEKEGARQKLHDLCDLSGVTEHNLCCIPFFIQSSHQVPPRFKGGGDRHLLLQKSIRVHTYCCDHLWKICHSGTVKEWQKASSTCFPGRAARWVSTMVQQLLGRMSGLGLERWESSLAED